MAAFRRLLLRRSLSMTRNVFLNAAFSDLKIVSDTAKTIRIVTSETYERVANRVSEATST